MELSRMIAKVFATYGMFTVSLAIGVISSVVIARVLGPEGKGQLALILLVPTTMMALGGLGIQQSTTYAMAKGQHGLDRVFSATLTAALLLGLTLFGLAILALQVFGDSILKGLDATPYFLMVSFIPLMLFIRYMGSLLRGMHRPITANVLGLVGGLVSLTLMGTLFITWGGTVTSAITAKVASLTLMVVVTLVVLWFREGWRIRFVIDRATIALMLRHGLQVSAVLAIGFLNRKISTFMVNAGLGNAEVGLFVVALSLAELVWFFPDAVGTILFPVVSSQSDEESNKVTPQMSRITVIVTSVIALGIFVVSRPMIPFLYGEEFAPAVEPLMMLLPGVVLLSVHKVLWRDVMGRGRPLLSFFSRAATLVVLVVLITLLTPPMGLAGVALATTLSFGVGTIVLVAVFSRHTGVSWTSVVIPQLDDFRLLFSAASGVLTSVLARRARLMTPAK